MLAVGPGARDKDGKTIEVSVKPGDRVLVPQVRTDSERVVWRRSIAASLRSTLFLAKLNGGRQCRKNESRTNLVFSTADPRSRSARKSTPFSETMSTLIPFVLWFQVWVTDQIQAPCKNQG